MWCVYLCVVCAYMCVFVCLCVCVCVCVCVCAQQLFIVHMCCISQVDYHQSENVPRDLHFARGIHRKYNLPLLAPCNSYSWSVVFEGGCQLFQNGHVFKYKIIPLEALQLFVDIL